jgi:formate transporter
LHGIASGEPMDARKSTPGEESEGLSSPWHLDALLPHEMAMKAEQAGVKKAQLNATSTFALAILGGAFIALGAIFATVMVAGGGLSYGLSRALAGIAFSVGLILVVVGGAELFTGNNLIVMACAGRKVRTVLLLRNWTIVYCGNMVGAVGIAVLTFVARQYEFGEGAVGVAALNVANAKVNLDFWQAVSLGVLCNLLVCLAVWLCFSARGTADRVLAIIPPISAFVAAGFEHSIANMYFIPMGILIKNHGSAAFWANSHASISNYQGLTLEAFLIRNLIPVTIGNVIGGALLVGITYWFVYLRNRPVAAPGPLTSHRATTGVQTRPL